MDQALAIGLGGAVFLGLLGAIEAASRRWKIGAEDSRKVAHVGAALIAASLPLFMAFPSVVILSAGFVVVMFVSRRRALFRSVHGVDRSTLGELYFPLGVAVTAALFPERLPYAYGVVVMGVSDAAASFIGQRYGRRPYRLLTSTKTYVGSAAFFAVTVIISLAALSVAGTPPVPAVGLGTLMAAALTLVEGVSGGGVDNALLPVAGAALLVWLT